MFGRLVAILAIPLALGTLVAATRLTGPAPVAVHETVSAAKPFEPPQVSLEAVSLQRKPEKKRKKRRRATPPRASVVLKPEASPQPAESAAAEPAQPPASSSG